MSDAMYLVKELHIGALQLKEKDILVVQSSSCLTDPKQLEQLKKSLAEHYGFHVPVLLLDGNTDLTVLSYKQARAATLPPDESATCKNCPSCRYFALPEEEKPCCECWELCGGEHALNWKPRGG